PGFYQELGYSRLSAYLTHSFTRDFNVEVAAMRTDAHTDNSDPQLAGGQALKVDTQPTLFNGAANPNAGKTYFEGLPQRNLNNTRVFRRTYVDLNGPSTGIVMADPRKGNPSGLTDPVLNATYTTAWIPFNQNTQLNSNEGTTLIGMLQSSLWKDRIQTIFGGSR